MIQKYIIQPSKSIAYRTLTFIKTEYVHISLLATTGTKVIGELGAAIGTNIQSCAPVLVVERLFLPVPES